MSIAQTDQQLTKKQYQGGPFSVKLTGHRLAHLVFFFLDTLSLCILLPVDEIPNVERFYHQVPVV